eukprot:TRINITY_DN19700_c0_g1_i1.p1 TRINITY_DN19700_c0_g1~~TRINITY_DN19700_c0_g1_i1.p1  ORF type:complete len:1240 (+),score=509.91 TRINITY_DN19700_c0_g1_i1:84-3803(+)
MLTKKQQEAINDRIVEHLVKQYGQQLGLAKGQEDTVSLNRVKATSSGGAGGSEVWTMQVCGQVPQGTEFEAAFEMEVAGDAIGLRCKHFAVIAKTVTFESETRSARVTLSKGDTDGWRETLASLKRDLELGDSFSGWEEAGTAAPLLGFTFDGVTDGASYRAVFRQEPEPTSPLAMTMMTSSLERTMTDRLRQRSDIIDGEKGWRASEQYASVTGTNEEVEEQMRELGQRMMRWYSEKPGDVVDEMLSNLRAPAGEDELVERLGMIAHVLAKEPRVARSFSDLSMAELLVVRGYTQKPIDVDRDVGWPDAPAAPSRCDTKAVTSAREAYEAKYNDWNWREERDGVKCRNGSLFGTVCSAMRDQGPGGKREQWSEQALRKWVKWLCTLAAVCAADGGCDAQDYPLWRGLGGGGLPGAVVDGHRGLQAGDVLGWPAPSSTSHDYRASNEYMWGLAANSTAKPSAAKPGTIMFRIDGVSTGRELADISQYPAEEELLLGPLTMFAIDEVEEDTQNPFNNSAGRPQGLQIAMRCLGPMGGRGAQWLHDFYAEVRRDAAAASQRLQSADPSLQLSRMISRAHTVAPETPALRAEAEAQVRVAQAECDRVRGELQQTANQLQHASQELLRLQQECNELHAAREEAARACEELAQCQRREHALRNELHQAADTAAEKCSDLSVAFRERDALDREREAALQERDDARRAAAALRRDIERGEEERRATAAELAKLRDAAARSEPLAAEKGRLTEERRELQQLVQELERRLAEAGEQRREVDDERRRLKHSLSRSEAECERLNQKCAADRAELEESLEALGARYAGAVESLRAEETRSDEMRGALRRAERQLDKAALDAAELQSRADAERRAAAIQEDSLRTELSEERRRALRRAEEADAAQQDLQQRLEQATHQHVADAQRAGMREEAQRAQIAELTEKCEQLSEAVERGRRHAEALETRAGCLVARHEEDARRWEEQRGLLREEVGRQEERLAEADAAAAALRTELDHLQRQQDSDRRAAEQQAAEWKEAERRLRGELRERDRELAQTADSGKEELWGIRQQLQSVEQSSQRREQQLQSELLQEQRRGERELGELQRRLRRCTEQQAAAEQAALRAAAERDALRAELERERGRQQKESVRLRSRLEEELGRVGGGGEAARRTQQEQQTALMQAAAARRDAERARAEEADERRRRHTAEALARVAQEELAALRTAQAAPALCERCSRPAPPARVSPRRVHSPRDRVSS